MKRLSIALAAIGLSASAFAALPAATDPTVVNVPQLPGGFVVGASGFYMQPMATNGDLDYANLISTNFNPTTGAFVNQWNNVQSVDPGYDWGWGINVGYVFPNTGNDVNVSYMNFSSSDTDSIATTPGVAPSLLGTVTGTGIAPVSNNLYDVQGFNVPLQYAAAKAQYDLNQVDAAFGQYINVGCRLILHPFAGVRWFDLERKLNSGYAGRSSVSGTIPIGDFVTPFTINTADSAYTQEKSTFDGAGPLVGLDMSYYIDYGIGVVGHFDSALAVGTIDATNNMWDVESSAITLGALSANSTLTSTSSTNTSNTTRLVPSVDAKLGLNYTYLFNNAYNSDLTLELGWQFSNYFNAVDRVAYDGVLHGTSDFGLQGPYVNLTFHA